MVLALALRVRVSLEPKLPCSERGALSRALATRRISPKHVLQFALSGPAQPQEWDDREFIKFEHNYLYIYIYMCVIYVCKHV